VAKEFQSWFGHVPRDRGSIWYLAPIFADIAFVALLVFVGFAIFS
jgi:hypothetical protein